MAGATSKAGPDFQVARPKRRFGWLVSLVQALIILPFVV